MGAGGSDFVQVIPLLFLIPNVQLRQLSHPYDGIHGRTDIMAHAGKEVALCLIRLLRLLKCILQQKLCLPFFFQGLLLHPAFFINIPGQGNLNQIMGIRTFHLHHLGGIPVINSILAYVGNIHGQNAFSPLECLCQSLPGKLAAKLLPVVRVDRLHLKLNQFVKTALRIGCFHRKPLVFHHVIGILCQVHRYQHLVCSLGCRGQLANLHIPFLFQ